MRIFQVHVYLYIYCIFFQTKIQLCLFYTDVTKRGHFLEVHFYALSVIIWHGICSLYG